MLTVVRSRYGYACHNIASFDAEVIAEHRTPDGVETLVEASKWGTSWIREMPVQAGSGVDSAQPAPDGWFADDNGGGALVTGDHWEQFDQDPTTQEAEEATQATSLLQPEDPGYWPA